MEPILISPSPSQINLSLVSFNKNLLKIIGDVFQLLNDTSCTKRSFIVKKGIPKDKLAPLEKIHKFIISVLQKIKTPNLDICETSRLLIPKTEYERINTFLEQGISLDDIDDSLSALQDLSDFIDKFNRNIGELSDNKDKACKIVEELKKQGLYGKDKSNIPRYRGGLLQLFNCSDAEIKKKAITYLIELLEKDPLIPQTAFDLVELQKLILEEIKGLKAQNLQIDLQRLLIRAYALSIECLLMHISMKHLNALTEELKQQIWSGAEELKKLNIAKDKEISFWSEYAIQGAQHIKTNESDVIEWLKRVGLVIKGIAQVASAFNNPADGGVVLVSAFEDFKLALSHIEWKESWFQDLLVYKKLARLSLNDIDSYRELTDLIRKRKKYKADTSLHYGLITHFEFAIERTHVQEVMEEAFKLLIQYFILDIENVQYRVVTALQNIVDSAGRGAPLAFALIKILHSLNTSRYPSVSELLEFLSQTMAASIKSDETLFLNVMGYILRHYAEIKQYEEMGGLSLITLLAHSHDKKAVGTLLACLHSLCPSIADANAYGETPYHLAAKYGNAGLAREISKNFKININDKEFIHQNTALHEACDRGDAEIAALFLSLGADPNLQNSSGMTPLHLASLAGDEETVDALLAAKVDTSLLNNDWMSALHVVVRKDSVALLKIFLKHGVRGESTIRMAAREKSEKTLIFLLEKNAAPLAPLEALEIMRFSNDCSEKFANFHHDKMNSDKNYREAILKFKKLAGSPGIDDYGEAPVLKYAVSNKSLDDLVRFAKEDKHLNDVNLLKLNAAHVAVMCHNYEGLKQLIALGANLNGQDILGFTPLHYAAFLRDPSLIELLLKSKASPSLKNNYGDTPLLIYSGNVPIRSPETIKLFSALPALNSNDEPSTVQMMIDFGCDPHSVDKQGRNALHHAFLNGLPKTLEYLWKNYPSLQWQEDNQGFLPIELGYKQNQRNLKACLEARTEHELIELESHLRKKNDNWVTLGTVLVIANLPEIFAKMIDQNPNIAKVAETSLLHLTPLHFAAIQNQKIYVELYDKKKLDLHPRDLYGNAPLHYAALHGNHDFILAMKETKTDLRVKNNSGRNPLHMAVSKGKPVFVKSLYLLQENLNCKDGHGDLPLHLACQTGKLDMVMTCAEFQNGKLDSLNDDGMTPLHIAASYGWTPLAEYLIENKADIDARNTFGETPLMTAASQGHKDICELLLKKGADLRAQDIEEESALHKAVFNGKFSTVKLLLDKDAEWFCPEDRRLINLVNTQKENATFMLSKKSLDGSVEIFKELLKHKASLNQLNYMKESFLLKAAGQGLNDLIDIVYENGKALMDHTDSRGNSALHHAVMGQKLKTIQKLVQIKKFNIDGQNNDGMTALHLACSLGFHEGAKLLLSKCSQPELLDSSDRTFLHCLVSRNELSDKEIDFLRAVLKMYPKFISMQDKKKMTLFHYAAIKNHKPALQVLMSQLRESSLELIWKVNGDGLAPYDIALKNQFTDIAQKIRTFAPK